MKQLSIKLRVTLFYTAILAVILSLMLGFVFLALDLRIVYSTRADLESAVENAFDDIDFKGGQLEIDSGIDLYHDGITLVLYGPAGTLLLGGTPAGFPAETPLIADTHQGVEGGGRKWQVFDMYVGYGETGVWVRGIYSLSANDSALNYVTVASTVSFPLVLLLSAAGGYLITKRLFAPWSALPRRQTAFPAAATSPHAYRMRDRMKLPDWHRPSTRCWIGWKPLLSGKSSLPPTLLMSCAHQSP